MFNKLLDPEGSRLPRLAQLGPQIGAEAQRLAALHLAGLGNGLGTALAGGFPVASSSRRARSAKASSPISSSMPWAVLSCSLASTRRFSRRSHSPYSR
jgi:hypothetical protein